MLEAKVTRDVICEAIEKRLEVSIVYSGSQRAVEPHILGYNAKGALILSAWQASGGSGQGWRDFFVDKIASITLGQTHFLARPGYNSDDSTLSQIICRLQ